SQLTLPKLLPAPTGGAAIHLDRPPFPSPACERAPVALPGNPGTLQRPPGRESRLHPVNCSWVIVGGEEQMVTIRFQKLHLSCPSERLVLQSALHPPVSLCELPAGPLQLPGGNATITYSYSGGGRQPGPGFLLSYTREGPECSRREFRCPNGRCVPRARRCDGVDSCGDGSDEAGCGPGRPCNHTLEGFYGVFSSAGPARACVWRLDPHDGRRLAVRFTALDLGYGDAVRVYDGLGPADAAHLLRSLDYLSNGQAVAVETLSGRATVAYEAGPWSSGRGFNATYHVRGYCLPWERPCGPEGEGPGGERCFGEAQRCDGTWDCADGTDEEGCPGCPEGRYPCGGAGGAAGACYPPADRCNYQTFCVDGADERRCRHCQPGNFRCRDERCVYETWVCDGQPDCSDGSDEWDCAYALPRKVVTAAVIGSLICGLLLVIALGCTCKLYAIRSHEYSIFAPLSRMEAEMVQQQAPPSYGQLIAQGAIPAVEDFPTENPNDNSVLGNLRSLLQILRHDGAVGARAGGSRRRQRSRTVRRLVRRLRRWGLLPHSAPPARTPEPGPPGPTAPSASPSPEGAAAEGGAAGGRDPEEAPALPVKVPPPPTTPPRGPPEPPAVPPPSLLSGVVQALRGRFLTGPRPPDPAAAATPDPRGGLPVLEDEDDVLLLPLAEPGPWEAEDELLLP
uniref:LDL receptor related protein 10 n=1 Tax=Ornithorhynchus anatinus TaxID=9258 RepID=A0A6I8NHQ1_ORNAN